MVVAKESARGSVSSFDRGGVNGSIGCTNRDCLDVEVGRIEHDLSRRLSDRQRDRFFS
jgi:hypothetical protein